MQTNHVVGSQIDRTLWPPRPSSAVVAEVFHLSDCQKLLVNLPPFYFSIEPLSYHVRDLLGGPHCPCACSVMLPHAYPQVETKALMKAGILGQCLSKKRSFTTADGVKPRAPPPKPRRVFEHIQETSDETLDRTRASTAVERRHKPPSPSFRLPTDLHNNRSSSPGNGATSPSNGTTSPSNMHRPTSSVSTKMQLRPLPETPTETQAAQYVCDVSLSLGEW